MVPTWAWSGDAIRLVHSISPLKVYIWFQADYRWTILQEKGYIAFTYCRAFLLYPCLFMLSMSVGRDVKWCPVSRITTPLARKRPFHWISTKRRLVRAARETSKFHRWSSCINSIWPYMAEILPIRRKTLYDQSINFMFSRTCFFKKIPFICKK